MLPRAIVPLLSALALASPLPAQTVEEEILSYDVGIEVRPGGSMRVTESIRVRALGQEIRRGIYRDFPTSFPRASGLGRIEAPFEVVDVRREGSREPYLLQAIGGKLGRRGARVRIGDADTFLDHGVHTYELTYETDRWIRFGEERDQLYWNVTGNGWSLPIRSVSARIRAPEVSAAPVLESWTGPEGATTSAATAEWDGASATARFQTSESLGPGEGLTIRVTWPSGELTPPTEEQRADWFSLDWGGYLDAGYLVLLVIAVYLLMWRRVGVDPPRSPKVPRREPPEGYSPAAIGFIEERGYEQRQLSSALVSMALKGAIRIDQQGGTWTLHRVGPEPDDLSPEEVALFRSLLGGREHITLKQSNHSELRSAIKAFKRSLSRRLERAYFVNNRRWFAGGLLVSIVGFVALAWRWRFDIDPPALFLGFWLTFWTLGVSTLAYRLWHQIRAARSEGGPAAWAGALFLALFSLPFFGAEIGVSVFLSTMVPTHLLLGAMVVGVTNVVFYHLLERPTLKGQGVLAHVDGFRSYLGEPDDRALHSTDRLARFEEYLPFAIALGLEDRWSTAFNDVLRPALVDGARIDSTRWYTHDHDHDSFSSTDFASSLGSGLSSTLSSASSPPSSGGSGGGGFSGGSSGGGGGGGGGGGW